MQQTQVDQEVHGSAYPDANVGVRALGQSLSDRMAARASYLEKHQTEKFPIPGYEGVLEVELRSLGYRAIRKVISRNEKIRDEGNRELYSLADQIVTATEGFFEVHGDESEPIQDDWVSLARRLPNPPEGLTPRMGVLIVVGDKRLPFLIQDWGEWAKSVRSGIDEEVEADFVSTG